MTTKPRRNSARGRNFHITVTKDVIATSKREHTGLCMIAQAIRERGGRSIKVTADSARFNFRNTRYMYPLPAKASLALQRFDKGEKVRPFAFNLHEHQCFAAPVIVRGQLAPYERKKAKHTRKDGPRVCKTRFHGVQGITVPK